jgi:hypothetical protein
MKIIVTVLAFALLAGCSGFIPLEELKADALRTGDWTLVEQRERLLVRRNIRGFMQCPPGHIGYCQEDFGRNGCNCVESAAVNANLDR